MRSLIEVEITMPESAGVSSNTVLSLKDRKRHMVFPGVISSAETRWTATQYGNIPRYIHSLTSEVSIHKLAFGGGLSREIKVSESC